MINKSRASLFFEIIRKRTGQVSSEQPSKRISKNELRQVRGYLLRIQQHLERTFILSFYSRRHSRPKVNLIEISIIESVSLSVFLCDVFWLIHKELLLREISFANLFRWIYIIQFCLLLVRGNFKEVCLALCASRFGNLYKDPKIVIKSFLNSSKIYYFTRINVNNINIQNFSYNTFQY